MTLDIDIGGTPIEAPMKRGRPRSRFAPAEKRARSLQIAFNEIAEAQPLRLIDIAARADVLRVRSRMRGGFDFSTLATLSAEDSMKLMSSNSSGKGRYDRMLPVVKADTDRIFAQVKAAEAACLA